MNLPRWTAYLALAVIGIVLVTALPKGDDGRPSEGAAEAARSGESAATKYPRLVVLGIDGMDPDVLADVVSRHPDKMPHFKRLMEEADGVRDLATSYPPQSPVAWSNFIAGRGPGGHGIYDFLHRSTNNYSVIPGTITESHTGAWPLPGDWQFPTSEGGDANRTGKAFWTILGENGVPADVWRMPINFPVEESAKGWSFPGMMTPAVDSAYGEPSLYSTNPPDKAISEKKIHSIQLRNGVATSAGGGPLKLLGPVNAMKESAPDTFVEFQLFVDEEANAAVLEIGSNTLVLEPGEWSSFVQVSYDMLPLGAMAQGGIVRFYLRSISPELELYASPVNVDPTAPINPVSYPDTASAELAEEIGFYYTQGMAEDVNALKKQMLTDAEFMAQARLVYEERGDMLEMALDKYMKNEEGGFLFFYYSSVDLCGHMMWRHADPKHPNYDEKIASEDSSWWSGREGTTWKDVVDDLYIRMDPVLGRVRERVGDDTTIIVMSDHGFASYRRKFSLNTWLLENGYLVLKDGKTKELPRDYEDYAQVIIQRDVDWSKTRAYGIGFNGLYLNLAGRESEGIVKKADAEALLDEIKGKLEAIRDEDGTVVVLDAALARDVYSGARIADAPDIQVGYNRGYGNSDESSLGRVTNAILSDNLGGTFTGSHLMDPSVVAGTLLTNRRIALSDPRLEDLTVEILTTYGIEPEKAMTGRPVLQD